jgi:hypothetical protein
MNSVYQQQKKTDVEHCEEARRTVPEGRKPLTNQETTVEGMDLSALLIISGH